MSANQTGGRIEARIGDAPHPYLAVVVGNVLDEPIDAVVGIGALIDVGRPAMSVLFGPHVRKSSFRHPAAAHILVDENILAFRVELRWAEAGSITVLAVRRDTVRCAVEQDRPWFGCLLGHIN